MWKKILNFLIVTLVIISFKSNTVFAEGTHISTGMSTKITRKLRTMISPNLSEEVRRSITLLLEKLRPHNFSVAQIESVEVQNDLNNIIVSIESNTPGLYIQDITDLKKLVKELKDEEYKEHILATYPAILDAVREIELDIPMPSGQPAIIRPDGHFIGDNGEEILVCFNNNLVKLREIIFHALEQIHAKHNIALWPLKERNISIAKSSSTNISKVQMRLSHLKSNIIFPVRCYYLFSSNIQKAVDCSQFLSEESAYLNKLKNEYGTQLDGNSTPCVVLFRKDLSDGGIKLLEDPFYGELESNIYRLFIIEPNIRNRIRVLDTQLHDCVRRYHPDASINNAIAFSFPLTRFDYYLRKIENSNLDEQNLKTVKAVRTFREKITSLSLQHKFLSLNEVAPILGIRVGRCKIVSNTKNKTMIFLERSQIKEFLKDIEDKLDTKASNITGNHDFVPMTGQQLRDLVKELNPESYQNALNNLTGKIIDMEAQKKSCRLKAAAMCAKASLKIAQDPGIVRMTFPTLLGEKSLKEDFTPEEIKEYLEVDKHLQSRAETHEIEFDVFEHMRTTNPTDDAQCIVVDKPLPITTKELQVDRGFEETLRIQQKKVAENTTKLGQALKHADLTPQDIDDLHSGLQCFVEGERIGEHIAIIEGQREYIQKLKDYESDFINLFKLYIKLWRLNLSDRVNYYGVLIEETANGTKDGQGKTMNEYTVTEVKKLEDIHYED